MTTPEQTESMTLKPAKSDPLGVVLFMLAALALGLAPTQITVPVKGIGLTPAEIVIALAAMVWVVRFLLVRDTRSLPPLTHWLVVGAAVLGIFSLLQDVPSLKDVGAWKEGLSGAKPAMVEIAQSVLYLLVAATIFRATLTTPDRIRVAVYALLAGTSLAVTLGVIQWSLLQRQYEPDPQKRVVFADSHARLDEDEEATGPKEMGYWDETGFHKASPVLAAITIQTPGSVSSTFGSWNKHGYHPSRHAYAGFLALVLPFALALWASARRWSITVWMGLLFAGAACSVLAGFLIPVILISLLVTGIALGAGRGVLIGIAAYLVLVLSLYGILFNGREMIEPFKLKISTIEAKYYSGDGKPQLKKYWGEQQAALNLFRFAPLFGVGAGKYQEAVSGGYDTLGSIEKQRLESDAQNGYLLTAASTGIVGLAALLLLFGSYLGLTRRALRTPTGNPWTAALYGALVALALLTLVTNPWVRGTALVVVAIMAMVGNGATEAPAMRIQGKEEQTPCEMRL